jgi:hypothetical protein
MESQHRELPDISQTGRTAISRRGFLEGAAALSGVLLLPTLPAWSAHHEFSLSAAAKQALSKSALLYLSPIQKNGEESSCHAEVWFAARGEDFYVVTASTAWRNQAIAKGLDRARVWVGDHGMWKGNTQFKSAPSYVAKASVVPKGDPAQELSLEAFGEKYAKEWSKWGPRFRNGLNDASRVMLRYRPLSA